MKLRGAGPGTAPGGNLPRRCRPVLRLRRARDRRSADELSCACSRRALRPRRVSAVGCARRVSQPKGRAVGFGDMFKKKLGQAALLAEKAFQEPPAPIPPVAAAVEPDEPAEPD